MTRSPGFAKKLASAQFESLTCPVGSDSARCCASSWAEADRAPNLTIIKAGHVSDFLTMKAEAAIIEASQILFDSMDETEQLPLFNHSIDEDTQREIDYFERRLASFLNVDEFHIASHWLIWLPIVKALQEAATEQIFEGFSTDAIQELRLAVPVAMAVETRLTFQ